MKDYEILGIDIGNALVKSSTGVIFDSKTTRHEPLYNADKIIIDGNTYWIGTGNYDTSYRKVDKSNYRALLLSAIALSTDKPVFLSLGLPLSQYRQDKGTLTNIALSINNTKVTVNGITKFIRIEDTEVFPEGVATLDDRFQGIVIDIGGRTTDCALVTSERGKRKIHNPLSLSQGTINLYADFIKALNNKFCLDLKLEDSERILANGLWIDGEKKNIDFATNIYKEFVRDIISRLNVEYSLRTNRISLTGGGSLLLCNFFKELLGNAELQEDSLFANANAYHDLGCEIWQ